jgi:hypothetical protein
MPAPFDRSPEARAVTMGIARTDASGGAELGRATRRS